ncbi:MAG: hypothetical protein HN348_09670 [Proteobacteria bacterium]|nr:hypothetical protein [Pseudomonadota bacterium]
MAEERWERKLSPEEIAFYKAVLNEGGVIRPQVDVGASVGFSYPSVGKYLGYEANIDLEYLQGRESQGLLRKEFYDRINLCPSCAHGAVNFREVCPNCSAANIGPEGVIHHFRCAYVAPESMFRQGPNLICPKCGHPLRSVGKDFERPSGVQHCNSCDELFVDPVVQGLCLSCGKRFPQENRVVATVYTFSVTAALVPAMEGADWMPLAATSIADELPGVTNEDFVRQSLDIEIKRAIRHGRELSVVVLCSGVLMPTKKDQRSHDHLVRSYQFAVALEQTRRDTDIIGRMRGGQLLFLLPETPLEGTVPMMARLAKAFGPVLDDLQIGATTFVEGDSVDCFIERALSKLVAVVPD